MNHKAGVILLLGASCARPTPPPPVAPVAARPAGPSAWERAERFYANHDFCQAAPLYDRFVERGGGAPPQIQEGAYAPVQAWRR
jgi:hypothetical protein